VPIGRKAFQHVDGAVDGAHVLGFFAHLNPLPSLRRSRIDAGKCAA
jgi:hypothetical protein